MKVLPRQRVAGSYEAPGADDGAIEAIKPLEGPVVLGTLRTRVAGHMPFTTHVVSITNNTKSLGWCQYIPPNLTSVSGFTVSCH